MPNKHNESRRHKIDKARYQVANWLDYNNALRERGDYTVYFAEEAIDDWHSAKAGKRGRPQKYSAVATTISLMIRQVSCLPLRQTQGFKTSMAKALGIAISVPDFSNLSKRSTTLLRHELTKGLQPDQAGQHRIVDSTGLKTYGKDEWRQEKHGVAARRTWRKLHLAVDENHQVLACELTTPEKGVPRAVTDLLDQIDTPFDTFIARRCL